MAFAAILGLLGRLLSGLALVMLVPAAVAVGYGERASAVGFLTAAAGTLYLGLLLVFVVRGSRAPLRQKDAMLLGLLAWTVPVPFAALPFWMSTDGMHFADAAFEAISGLTTTGLSVFIYVDEIDRSLLVVARRLQWIGGLITLAFAFVVLPSLGSGGLQVHRMDSPSRIANTMRPRIRQGAMAIGVVYGLLTVVCAIALWIAGMPGLESICFAMSTLSTGGFGTRAGGVEAFENPTIELVLMAFMLIAAINFFVHWRAAQRGPRVYLEDPEVGLLIALAVSAIGLAIVADAMSHRLELPGEVRRVAFAAIAALTTTGFETGMVGTAPGLIVFMLLALAIVGGSTGSTAGGLTLMRVVLLLRQGAREMILLARPHAVVLVKFGGASVPSGVVETVWGYFGAYLFGLILLTVALAAWGHDFSGAITMAVSAMTNTGPGLAEIAEIDALDTASPDMAKLTMALGMLIGRLEILTVLVLANPRFWAR